MGGTYTRIASSKDLSSIYQHIKFNTKKDLIDQKNNINYQIKKLSEGERVLGICLGVPGTLDIKNKKFLKFPNYKVLESRPFSDLLSGDFSSIPLIVVNDSHMAGYMETVKGVGEKYDKVLYLSVGTGIGGLYMKDKSIDGIFQNFEPGHECVFSDGLDLEEHCAGHGFKRMYGSNPNDTAPSSVWETYAKDLYKGVSFLSTKYPSDIIVLGGGFSVNNFQYFHKYLPKGLNIKLAEYGDDSGILGGFEILSKTL